MTEQFPYCCKQLAYAIEQGFILVNEDALIECGYNIPMIRIASWKEKDHYYETHLNHCIFCGRDLTGVWIVG